MTEIGYDAGDRGEPEYPEQHKCDWEPSIGISNKKGICKFFSAKCKNDSCGKTLSHIEIAARLNEYDKLFVELNEFAVKIIDLKNEIVAEQLKSIRLKKATEALSAEDARRISNRKLPVSEHEELQAYADILEGK